MTAPQCPRHAISRSSDPHYPPYLYMLPVAAPDARVPTPAIDPLRPRAALETDRLRWNTSNYGLGQINKR